MARARVELRGCASHTGRGVRHEKGEPFYTTNAADIAYFKAQGVYSVSILEDDPPAKRRPAPAPEPDPEPVDVEDEDEDEGNDLSDPSYTKSDLVAMKKKELAKLAADDFDVDLDPDKLKKSQMVAAIMKAQIDLLAAVDDDDDE